MDKVIHEYWYTYGNNKIDSHYELRVNRETPKMFYGKVYYNDYSQGDFAVKKDTLNQVAEIRKFARLEYRVQIYNENEADAREEAIDLIYEHIMRIASKLVER
jgi:hypothetical protein